MRYILLRTLIDYDAEEDSAGSPRTDRPPVLCETRGEAEAALEEWRGSGPELVERDWSVWEVVDGQCVQRSVVFKDGHPEIQSPTA